MADMLERTLMLTDITLGSITQETPFFTGWIPGKDYMYHDFYHGYVIAESFWSYLLVTAFTNDHFRIQEFP